MTEHVGSYSGSPIGLSPKSQVLSLEVWDLHKIELSVMGTIALSSPDAEGELDLQTRSPPPRC
ncbi:MAG: hypothetical protein F6K30_02425 [Cyanothece sp. SIO2G6]|nr:hypothetical protein [Cyanothece sp. SIO2G6]